MTSAAAATWRNVGVVDVQLLAIGHRNRNVGVVDVQLLAIGHRNRNALLLQMRIG